MITHNRCTICCPINKNCIEYAIMEAKLHTKNICNTFNQDCLSIWGFKLFSPTNLISRLGEMGYRASSTCQMIHVYYKSTTSKIVLTVCIKVHTVLPNWKNAGLQYVIVGRKINFLLPGLHHQNNESLHMNQKTRDSQKRIADKQVMAHRQ